MGLTPAPPSLESVRWCREEIRNALSRTGLKTTAVSIALFCGDRVVWREAFGYADREKGLLATTDSRVNIGSVAKLVATLAVMILRDRQQLALDQPLVELLPSFRMLSPQYRQITVRHLVSHASGRPGTNNLNLFNFNPYPGYAQDTLDALAQSHLKHEPGELSVYCNDGFTLIESLVRQLTGLPFADFVQREILSPLGMDLSGYPTAPLPEGTFIHPVYEGRQLPQEMPAALAAGGRHVLHAVRHDEAGQPLPGRGRPWRTAHRLGRRHSRHGGRPEPLCPHQPRTRIMELGPGLGSGASAHPGRGRPASLGKRR